MHMERIKDLKKAIVPEDIIMEPMKMENNFSAQDDGRDPLSILPEELWEIILCMLKDSPDDLVSCCRASLSWDDILKSRKSTWMFAHIFPFIYPYLKKVDILKCRKVCKHWMKGVDDFIENHPCHRPSQTSNVLDDVDTGRESVYYPLISKQLYEIRFVEPEELSDFRNKMGAHTRNPIIGRSVSFYSRVNDEWMMNALHFLSAFGKHIWYFSFESVHAPIRFIQWLRQCLTLLPNLRRLHIISLIQHQNENEAGGGAGGGGGGGGDENANENQAEGLDQIMEDLNANPLPPLPYLESLEVCTHNLPKMIQDSLVAAYVKQIYRLQLNEWNEMYVTGETYCFGNVRELSLTIDSNELLGNLMELNCPNLTKLNLTLRYNEIDLPLLFKILQKLGESLRVLKVSVSPGSAFKEDYLEDDDLLLELYFARMNMPHLKTLVLVNFSSLSYNFLAGMDALQYLHIERWTPDPGIVFDSEHEIVQFTDFIGKRQMYASNIWEVLPALKQLTYHDLSEPRQRYNRRMYEHIMSRRVEN